MPPRVCFTCRKEVALTGKIGRREVCPHCGQELHVCRNCRFYDPRAYNACRESQAERVVDKERGNFCDYFAFREGEAPPDGSPAPGDAARDKLASLFKEK